MEVREISANRYRAGGHQTCFRRIPFNHLLYLNGNPATAKHHSSRQKCYNITCLRDQDVSGAFSNGYPPMYPNFCYLLQFTKKHIQQLNCRWFLWDMRSDVQDASPPNDAISKQTVLRSKIEGMKRFVLVFKPHNSSDSKKNLHATRERD